MQPSLNTSDTTPSTQDRAIARQYVQHTCEVLCAEAYIAEQRYHQTLLAARSAQMQATKARKKASEAIRELKRVRECDMDLSFRNPGPPPLVK
jgi:hypothetical protein